MRRLVFALALVLAPLVAHADQGVPAPKLQRNKFSGAAGTAGCPLNGSCPILNGIAANAAAGSRTFTLQVAGYAFIALDLNFTWSAATAETMTCKYSYDWGSTYGQESSTVTTSGVGTNSLYSDSIAVSANDHRVVIYATHAADYMQCVWAASGGGAGDTVIIKGAEGVGQ